MKIYLIMFPPIILEPVLTYGLLGFLPYRHRDIHFVKKIISWYQIVDSKYDWLIGWCLRLQNKNNGITIVGAEEIVLALSEIAIL